MSSTDTLAMFAHLWIVCLKLIKSWPPQHIDTLQFIVCIPQLLVPGVALNVVLCCCAVLLLCIQRFIGAENARRRRVLLQTMHKDMVLTNDPNIREEDENSGVAHDSNSEAPSETGSC